MDDTQMLNDFMREQERRVDFGHSLLFRKVQYNENTEVTSDHVLKREELDHLAENLKQDQISEDFDGDYIHQTHKRIMSTMQYLMVDIGLTTRY